MISAILHSSLLISDLEKSKQFYKNVLGLEQNVSRPDLGYPGLWFNAGSQQIHLLLLPNPDATEGRPEHGGRDRHIALAVDDVAKLEKSLSQAGVKLTKSRSGRAALFCRDPDGNALEFIQTK